MYGQRAGDAGPHRTVRAMSFTLEVGKDITALLLILHFVMERITGVPMLRIERTLARCYCDVLHCSQGDVTRCP